MEIGIFLWDSLGLGIKLINARQVVQGRIRTHLEITWGIEGNERRASPTLVTLQQPEPWLRHCFGDWNIEICRAISLKFPWKIPCNEWPTHLSLLPFFPEWDIILATGLCHITLSGEDNIFPPLNWVAEPLWAHRSNLEVQAGWTWLLRHNRK